jgi:hypothetical protein
MTTTATPPPPALKTRPKKDQRDPATYADAKLKRGRCSLHSRYEGKNPPRCACPICWGIFLNEKYGMAIEEVLAPAVVHLIDPVDVARFIAGMKSALDRSRANGGSYSAFCRDRKGRTFQVDVQLRMKSTG